MANFKYAPRLRVRGQVRRWSLHQDDFMPLVLHDVDSIRVEPLRSDLHYLNCCRMPRVILDQLESRMSDLWTALEWANDEDNAHFSNCFRLANNVPVYNIKELLLPSSGLCRLRVTVQGVHCDTRLGNNYAPIIIIEEVLAGRAPTIHVRGKQMQLPVDLDAEDEEEADEEEAEEASEPPAKRCRQLDNDAQPEFTDDEEAEDEDEPSVYEIEDDNDSELELDMPAPAAPPAAQLIPAPAHPRLATLGSRYIWQRADEDTRKRYFMCIKHQSYLCPDCKVHVDWVRFEADHYGCSDFGQVGKAALCSCSVCHT